MLLDKALVECAPAARISKVWVAAAAISSMTYAASIAWFLAPASLILLLLFLASQLFRLGQALVFCYTVWPRRTLRTYSEHFVAPVDVFITTAGEDLAILEQTIEAAKRQDYPCFTVYVLNDGYVLNAPDWREIEELAERLGVRCITRRRPGGAKAGNINHALGLTDSPFVAVLDVDHKPNERFLRTLIGWFAGPEVGFVQSPQYYRNRGECYVSAAAFEQQQLFFNAIATGKNALNSAFMCGTNMILRRRALEDVGGMDESNVTEDFLTSLFLHRKGWKSVYVPTVLSEGLGPVDALSYHKQQLRWAKGCLEVLFRHAPWRSQVLSRSQRIQYVFSASHYLSGLALVLEMAFPLMVLFTGAAPFYIGGAITMSAWVFFVGTMLLLVRLASSGAFTFRALSFTIGSFAIYVRALIEVAAGLRSRFAVTPKRRSQGNGLHVVLPHLIYSMLAGAGIASALVREGPTIPVLASAAWAVAFQVLFIPFVAAALPQDARWIASPSQPPSLTRESAVLAAQPQQ